MRLYIVTSETDPHSAWNPYIYTLMDSMSSRFDVQFGCGPAIFWTDRVFEFDVIHIMWPTNLLDGLSDRQDAAAEIERRLKLIREKNVKVVGTCHNLVPHYGRFGQVGEGCYEVVYANCDLLIHLGQYSHTLLQRRFPHVKHTIIPHHVYDLVYKPEPDRSKSLRHLKLSDKYQYVLCYGQVRSKEEIKIICHVGRRLKHLGVRMLAPRIMHFPYGRKNPIYWTWAIVKYVFFRHSGVVTFGKGFVSDEDLPHYYAASSLCLIHRKEILNSGNVPMAFFMGKVAVGPDVGNVGCLLKDYNNPVFDPCSPDSVVRAVEQGFSDAKEGLGERNRQRALKECSTQSVAQRHYDIYRRIVDRKKA